MPKRIVRNCSICGDKINIKVDEKGKYNQGYYFGKIKLPVEGTGKYKQVGASKLLRAKVVKWTGESKECEYWECNLCYNAASREDWLEERIRKYYGTRCPDFEPSCIVCDVWALYDKIVKDNSLRGNFRQTYDKDADAAYIYTKRSCESVRQIELSDHVILDFDKYQNLIGIEVLNAKRCMPKVFKGEI